MVRAREQNFSYVQQGLHELEAVHKMMLPSMFDVANQNFKEQQEQVTEATFEFKMDNLDPNRVVARYEQERLNKERKKHAKKKFAV